jgi:hypothetical protein
MPGTITCYKIDPTLFAILCVQGLRQQNILKTPIDGNPPMIYLSIIGFNIELDYNGKFEMPNWCCTDFIASGPAEDIARFREAVRRCDGDTEIPFDFNRLDPMPSELPPSRRRRHPSPDRRHYPDRP